MVDTPGQQRGATPVTPTPATQPTTSTAPTGTEGWETIEPSGRITTQINTVYPPGVVNPQKRPAGQQGVVVTAPTPPDPATIAGGPRGGENLQPGSPTYDLYRVNEALIAFGMDGWRIANTSATPIRLTKLVKNPDPTASLDPESPDYKPYIEVPSNEYTINAIGPDGTVRQLTLNKVQDPSTGQYAWGVADSKDVVKADPSKKGWSNLQQINGQVWGTNNADGNFELVPGAPTVKGNWSSIQQIEMPDHSKQWWGINPDTHQPEHITSMPDIPAVTTHTGLVQRQVGDKIVTYGQNTATGAYEPVPGLPSEPVEKPGPASITGKTGTIYVKDPITGQYSPAPGVPEGRKAGDLVYQLGDDGNMYRFKADGQGGLEPDNTFEPEPFTPAAKRQQGAILPKGTRYQVQNGDFLITYIADGNGGTTGVDKDIPPQRNIPKDTQAATIATSNDQPYIVRTDPSDPTGQKTVTIKNPNYQPKESDAMLRKLDEDARAKSQELFGKIGTNGYTTADADRDFNQWWTVTVEPQRAAIAQKQQAEQLDAQIKIAQENRARDTQQANLVTAAQAYGQNLVSNFQAQAKNMVGPGYGDWARAMSHAINTGGRAPDLNVADFQYQAPDFNALSEFGVAQYLQHVSPTAAAIANGSQKPTYLQNVVSGVDPNAILDITKFRPSATPAAAPPVTINVNTGQSGATGATQPTGATPSAAPANQVPGQNYGAATAYTGGINPWNAQPADPSAYLGNFQLT